MKSSPHTSQSDNTYGSLVLIFLQIKLLTSDLICGLYVQFKIQRQHTPFRMAEPLLLNIWTFEMHSFCLMQKLFCKPLCSRLKSGFMWRFVCLGLFFYSVIFYFEMHLKPEIILVQGPTILLVQEGQGEANCLSNLKDEALLKSTKLTRGDVYFVPAETSLKLKSHSKALCLWIAAVHSQVFADNVKLPVVNAKKLQKQYSGFWQTLPYFIVGSGMSLCVHVPLSPVISLF